MPLALDASSPAVVSTAGGSNQATTASFTPPAGSVLTISWAGNSAFGLNPPAPSITDNLGVHLSYTVLDFASRNDNPDVEGQAASWVAVVTNSAAMTVTVTNNATTANGENALKVKVWTGADTATPIGVHSKANQVLPTAIAQNYTAQRTGGRGVLGLCDWDIGGTPTAGTGCTTTGGGAGTNAGIAYAFILRTVADDVAGATNTLRVNPITPTNNLHWVYFEVLPADEGSYAGPYRGPTPGRISPTGRRSAWRPLSVDPSGTGYTSDLAGSITPAGALTLLTGKALAGGAAPGGALGKAVTKPGLAGSVTPAGTLANQANKSLAGSVTPTGVLTTVKIVLLTFAGSVTATGSLAKLVAKALTGSATPTGSLTRLGATALAGAVTATGAVVKLVGKTLAGSATPTGALAITRVLLRSFAGAVTATGALAKQAGKALVGSVSPTGTLTRQAGKALAGSVTAAGSLPRSVTKTLVGVSTPTGVLTAIRLVLRALAGAVTATGVLARQAGKALAGTSTPAGGLARSVTKAFGGALAAAGALAKLVTKPFAGSGAPSGSLAAVIPDPYVYPAIGVDAATTGAGTDPGATAGGPSPAAATTAASVDQGAASGGHLDAGTTVSTIG